MREAYQYAIWRIIPALERGECLNAGVVLFCRRAKFLDARIQLDHNRLRALAPAFDPAEAETQLLQRARIARGDSLGGPIALQAQSERFGWLVSPSSTSVQPSAVHTGLCENPELALEHLFKRLVS